MLCPFEFFDLIRKMIDPHDQDDRKVLIRIALNALYAPDAYPVDLSELMGMQEKHVVLARGFLARCALEPQLYYRLTDDRVRRLRTYLMGGGLRPKGDAISQEGASC